MSLVYNGCFTKNADGANKLIGPGEKCLTLSVSGKTLKMFVQRSKHAVNQQINLLIALKTTSTIFKKSNV